MDKFSSDYRKSVILAIEYIRRDKACFVPTNEKIFFLLTQNLPKKQFFQTCPKILNPKNILLLS